MRVVVGALALVAPAAAARIATAQLPAAAWTVRSAEHVDLWFHGLATVGFAGDGVPLYDPAYASRARCAKIAAGVYPTKLDRRAAALLAGIRKDRAFEILHFVPLYFVDADRVSMLDALSAAARGADVADVRTRRAAAAVAAALPRSGQRRLLAEYVELLEDEWRDYYGPATAASASERQRATAMVAAAWNTDFATPLAPFFTAHGVRPGTIVLSSALGAEGRVISPGPGRAGGVLVVVRAPRTDEPAEIVAPAFRALRELCFPVARAVLAAVEPSASDGQAIDSGEALSGTLAARCGAMVLARFAAPLRQDYEVQLRRGAATFDLAFPLSAGLERQLSRVLAVP